MKKSSVSKFAILLISGVAQHAFAQTAQPLAPAAAPPISSPAAAPVAPEATSAPTTGAHLDEIVVTAQRRRENLQNVPISVTAITPARLQSTGVLSTASLPTLTPALTLGVSVGFLEPKLRGIGNTSAGPGIENSVATYVDGVYIASAPGTLLSLNNIERVEVLKGPQGTLFGRNATGGLIQIVTKDPSHTFGGDADVSYGNYDTSHVDLYMTGPISDKVAADIAISAGHQGDGYLEDPVHGKDLYKTDRDITARSKWLINFDEKTTVRVAFDFEDLASNDPAFVSIPGTINAYTKPLVFNPFKDDPLDGGARRQLESGGVSVKADHDFGAVTLTSISAYRRDRLKEGFDADGTPAPAIYRSYPQDDEQLSQELQLTPSHKSRLTWVVGAYYYDLNSGFHPFTDYHNAPLAATTNTMWVDSRTVSEAVYAQATYEIFKNTNITGGIRYTNEEHDLSAASGVMNGLDGSPIPRNLLKPLPYETISTGTPTARFAIDHKFDNDVMVYFTYNRGFKSGGFNTQSPTSPAFQPEYLDAYEGGFKSTLFDRSLRLNVSAFDYEYDNIQVNTFIGSVPIIYNGAAAEIYGLDGDFDWVLTNDLSLNGGVTLLHDRFTDFPNAVVTKVLASGATTTGPGSATGNRLPFAPDAVVNIGADYKHNFEFGQLELSLQNQYNTGYYGQPDNFLKQKAFDTLNGTVTYRPANTPYYMQVYATNMLNNHVYNFMNSATTGLTVAYNPPLLFGGRVGVKF